MKQKLAHGKILSAIILMDILTGMEFDLFVPSFPELQERFNLSPFWVEASLSINFVGFCLSLFVTGGLADRYGRKPIILLGLLIFNIGSLFCLSEISYAFFMLGRLLQGIGVAAPTILSFLIISDTYPLRQQQALFAVLNGVMNASAGIAPVIGSYITLYFHWQGNFIALLLLGMLAFILSYAFIPLHKAPQFKDENSYEGYSTLLHSKSLILLIMHFVFQFVPYWIFVGMSPLLFMGDLGVSLNYFGFYQGSLAFIYAVGSLLFGLIVSKYNQVKMIKLSIQIFLLSLVTLGIVTYLDSTSAPLITIAFIPFIIGQIIPITILYPICLQYIPQAKGRVAAIIQGARLIFSALSLQVVGYFYIGTFQNIGIIMAVFIVLTTVTLWFVVKSQKLMTFAEGK